MLPHNPLQTGEGMEKFRFLLSGAGGQGIISMGVILAEAAVLHDGLNAVQTQSYGPEARGGATRSDVIISDAPIHFPKVLQPNVLLALTSEAAAKYLPLARPGALVLYDPELVRLDLHTDARLNGLPMRRATLEALGSVGAFNITVLGALAVLTGAVRLESLEKVLKTHFRAAYHDANSAALRLGARLAEG